MKFTVIGIDDNGEPFFSGKMQEIIANGTVFSGGKRHHGIVSGLLPAGSRWIEITAPLDPVLQSYRIHPEIIVFASGDPLFYGFGNTLKERFPEAEIVVFPFFNSLQILAHRTLAPYHKMKPVSLTGRPWDELDSALIRGEEVIGVLTDRIHTPVSIARRMLEYDYDNYLMAIGEKLGNPSEERITLCAPSDATKKEFAHPNNILLTRIRKRERLFGIPESQFELLDNREKMITKMPVRLLSLAYLGLHGKSVLWDIGFCTGSVSVEAKLQFPHLKIIAFEQREKCEEILLKNMRRFGAPGITPVMGDFTSHTSYPFSPPDAVFIGGHGGKMEQILQIIKQNIRRSCTVVFNAVSEETHNLFCEAIRKNGGRIVRDTCISIDEHNPINVVEALLNGTTHDNMQKYES